MKLFALVIILLLTISVSSFGQDKTFADCRIELFRKPALTSQEQYNEASRLLLANCIERDFDEPLLRVKVGTIINRRHSHSHFTYDLYDIKISKTNPIAGVDYINEVFLPALESVEREVNYIDNHIMAYRGQSLRFSSSLELAESLKKVRIEFSSLDRVQKMRIKNFLTDYELLVVRGVSGQRDIEVDRLETRRKKRIVMRLGLEQSPFLDFVRNLMESEESFDLSQM